MHGGDVHDCVHFDGDVTPGGPLASLRFFTSAIAEGRGDHEAAVSRPHVARLTPAIEDAVRVIAQKNGLAAGIAEKMDAPGRFAGAPALDEELVVAGRVAIVLLLTDAEHQGAGGGVGAAVALTFSNHLTQATTLRNLQCVNCSFSAVGASIARVRKMSGWVKTL